MCGILGVVANTPVNQVLYDGLQVLQHRGQDAAGIATLEDRTFHLHKGNGLVRDVFRTRNMRNLVGRWGIGHCRYPTAGSAFNAAEAQKTIRFQVVMNQYQQAIVAEPSASVTAPGAGKIELTPIQLSDTTAAPGRPVVLVMRSHAPFRLRVETGDGFRGIWSSVAGTAGLWSESAFTVPESGVRGDRLTVRLSSDDPHHSAYGSFHYWIYQR